MDLRNRGKARTRLALAFLLTIVVVQLFPLISYAQNLGTAPATGQAVQGQTAAQPEGTVLNLVNWVGNVIAPVGAVLAVVMAVVSYSQGRGVARWAVTAGGLLVISGLTRLIEFWIQNGTGGVQ
jgi:hypothetical protein